MTNLLRQLPLYPTSVIGSLPRPAWLLDLLGEYLAGRLARAEWDCACDQAVPFAIALQETAGIDIISDGEWRREGYFQVVYERVEGFKPDLIPGRTRRWPAAVAVLRRRGPIVADGAAFLRKHTQRAIKVSLPSAYVILRRFYSPEHSAAAYPTREHFLRAVEEILLEEALDVLDAGADCIQLDDPMIGYFVDPRYREQRSGHWGTGQFADVESELRLAIDSVNRLAGPLRQRGAYVVLHVCRGNIERRSDAQGISARSGRRCAGRRWTSWLWSSRCPRRARWTCWPACPRRCGWSWAAWTFAARKRRRPRSSWNECGERCSTFPRIA
jgi:5-methyltetrahydropteroyltriglutamate--homocysteine methyltransferase